MPNMIERVVEETVVERIEQARSEGREIIAAADLGICNTNDDRRSVRALRDEYQFG